MWLWDRIQPKQFETLSPFWQRIDYFVGDDSSESQWWGRIICNFALRYTKTKQLPFVRQPSLKAAVSDNNQSGQCKTQTADRPKMQTERKMQIADCRPRVKCRLRVR